MDPLAYLFGLEQFGIKFGLENIRAIVARLGHPERSFKSVHIAGTNGKGSVAAMVEAGLRAAGCRTGRYTSPHLVRLNERFAIDGRAVDDEPLLEAIEKVRGTVEALRTEGILEVHPTFFEVTTAVAFDLFRRSAVEVAVVEVGLGGRLDATNVLTPEVCAITSIAFDHQLYLGNTLAQIAREKAGIVKAGVPLVIGPMEASAGAAIEEVARAHAAPIVRASASDLAGRTVRLRGEHQRTNAAIAVRVLQILAERGVAVTREAMDAALTRTEWPGRLDLRRLPDGRELLLDAAHNADGAEALAAYLHGTGDSPPPLVFAAMRDKDVRAMFRALLPAVGSVTFTKASTQRSAETAQLAAAARDLFPHLAIAEEPSPIAAVERGWRSARRVVVAGSIFLLGDVMKHFDLDPSHGGDEA